MRLDELTSGLLVAGSRANPDAAADPPGRPSAAVVAELRRTVPGPGPDRHLAPEIAAAVAGVRNGSLLAAAEGVTGPLG